MRKKKFDYYRRKQLNEKQMKLMGMRQQSFSKSDTMFLTFLTAFVKQDPNFPFLLILLFHSLETKMERERVNHVREDRYREYGPNNDIRRVDDLS